MECEPLSRDSAIVLPIIIYYRYVSTLATVTIKMKSSIRVDFFSCEDNNGIVITRDINCLLPKYVKGKDPLFGLFNLTHNTDDLPITLDNLQLGTMDSPRV